jgi:AcrR family transcriptional regulator
MSRVGRPKVHDDKTAVALLDAAERAIEERGVGALLVRGVAADVGVSTRAVYSLFGSKEGLIAALAVRAFDLLATAVGQVVTTTDPIADLVQIGLAYRQFALDHPALFVIGVQRTESRIPDELWGAVQASATRGLGMLEERIARVELAGLLGARTIRAAAYQFVAYCEGAAAHELRGTIPVDVTMKQLWADGLNALLRGFTQT